MPDSPKFLAIKAYIDTVALFSRRPLPVELFKDVRHLQNRPLITELIRFSNRNGRGARCHYLNSVHQPRTVTLRHLGSVEQAGLALNAVHIAVDFFVSSTEEALAAQAYFSTHMRQTWRRPQPSISTENTDYWKRDAKARRNIALYGDRPSKINGQPCCHLEFRFTGAQACKRAGLGDLDRLQLGVDVVELLQRQAAVMTMTRERFDRTTMRLAREYFSRTRLCHPAIGPRGSEVALTIDLLAEKMRVLLLRGLGVAPHGDYEDALARVRSQDLWDSSHAKLRSSLIHVPWKALAPSLTWHHWV